jgi:hypothetical protein
MCLRNVHCLSTNYMAKFPGRQIFMTILEILIPDKTVITPLFKEQMCIELLSEYFIIGIMILTLHCYSFLSNLMLLAGLTARWFKGGERDWPYSEFLQRLVLKAVLHY